MRGTFGDGDVLFSRIGRRVVTVGTFVDLQWGRTEGFLIYDSNLKSRL